MRNLKRRLFDRQPRSVMEDALAQTENVDVTESGTYPVSSPRAGAPGSHRGGDEVTLVVYGWDNVQPGTLSWVFPSFDAAMKAASALRNATKWAIMGGSDATGAVLAERSA